MVFLNMLEVEEYIKVRTSTFIPTITATTNSGTLTLTSASGSLHFLTGTGTSFNVVLPDATTLQNGTVYKFYNRSSQTISIRRPDNSLLSTVGSESFVEITLQDNSTVNGLYATLSLEVGQASGIVNFTNESSTDFVTTSLTDVLITGMTITPVSGRYLALYDSSNTNTNNNSLNYISLYRDSVQITGTERVARSTASNFVFLLTTQGVVDLNGTQIISARVRTTTGTLTVGARSLVLIRLGGVV
jgi:hypothetical protein